MGEPSDSIDITCPKCRKKFPVPAPGMHYDPATQCPKCNYFVFTLDETRRAFFQAIEQRDADVGGQSSS